MRLALVELLDAKPHIGHLRALLILVKDEWSRRASYYGEDDYPIAQAAVPAVAKLGAIDGDTADELYRVAVDARPSDLRDEIFALLVRAADKEYQNRLFELAFNPGRKVVRHGAAHALLAGNETVASEVVGRITSQLLTTRIEVVASRFLMLLSLRGELGYIVRVAEALATNEKRRVLLLLAIWVLRERDRATAERIANMLPINHTAVSWALGGAKGKFRDSLLDSLGDPLSVDQVLLFMRPKRKQR